MERARSEPLPDIGIGCVPLLDACDLFLGTSSGFGTMATFSRVPYLITSIEEMFAPYAGIPVGAERYPFAHEQQRLVWRQEDALLLRRHFEQVYGASARRSANDRVTRTTG